MCPGVHGLEISPVPPEEPAQVNCCPLQTPSLCLLCVWDLLLFPQKGVRRNLMLVWVRLHCGRMGSGILCSLAWIALPVTAATPGACSWSCRLWFGCCRKMLLVVAVQTSAETVSVSSCFPLHKGNCLCSESRWLQKKMWMQDLVRLYKNSIHNAC